MSTATTYGIGAPCVASTAGLPNSLVLVPPSGTGLGGATNTLILSEGKNANGSVLVASGAGAGNFLIASTAGTSLALTGEAAQNTTKTDIVLFETKVPANFGGASTLTVTVNALYVLASGTTLTSTILAAVYPIANDGTQSANLVTTTAQALTAAAADYAFTFTSTSLTGGQRLLVKLTSVATEGGNTGTITNSVGSVRIS